MKDVHQIITDAIIASIEASPKGKWNRPWAQTGGGIRPTNVASGNAYKGVNVLALWCAAAVNNYSTPVWGTYRQWLGKGAQVRKGERSTTIVFFKPVENQNEDGTTRRGMIATASPVFNVNQVDGYAAEAVQLPNKAESLANVDAFVRGTNAVIREDDSRAYYIPSRDSIHMPPAAAFYSTEARYATLLHELIHWSGSAHRLDRQLTTRFGSDAYAAEELVAELGAAFLCGTLGISAEPREDHAHYIASWLKVLKADKKAIFTASSAASKAAEYLEVLQQEKMQEAA